MSKSTTPRLVSWVILTGLVAGTLDITAAIIRFKVKEGNQGKDPTIIFNYIASAVFGKEAFTGGTTMILWGAFFHFLIAMLFTIFFYGVYRKIKFLSVNAIVTGLLYGVFVWIIMNRVVVPLSLIPKRPFHFTKESAIQMGILMLCIGLPISLMAKKYYLYRK
jgi:uncharacterized membrane protein YagU involved in acid resistance